MEAKMKKLIIVVASVQLLSFSVNAVQVDGYCFLENQSNHSGIKVLFQADSPSAVTDSTYTNFIGNYQIDVSIGIYDIYFSHIGYQQEEILDQPILSAITLSDVTLIEIPTYISGQLSGVLSSGNYIVTGNISIQNGDSLIIEPGTNFYFNGDYGFDVYGYLCAEGTQEDSIKFMPYCGVSYWRGIDFEDSSDDSSKLVYCLVTGGNASGSFPEFLGGGILLYYSSPTISNCTISGNSASSGGGICCWYSSSPIILNCTISLNYAGNGGGIHSWVSSPIIEDCIIIGNSSSRGGGINCIGGNPVITCCIIKGNDADLDSGGLYCSSSATVTISGNLIIENSAYEYGGGICCFTDSDPNIINCTLSRNSAEYGGGIYIHEATPTVISTILESNTGGDIYFDNSPNASITYCDLYNNEYQNFVGNIPQWLGQILTINANGDSCDIYLNIFEDPIFINPVNGDYHIYPISSCIDAGDPNSPLDPDSTIADIGAYFYDQNQTPLPIIVISTDSLFFPETTVGDTSELPFKICNMGLVDLSIDSLVIGQYPNIFSTNWNIGDSVIVSGDSLPIVVSFAPLDTIVYTDILSIYNNDTLAELYLEGGGIPSSLVNRISINTLKLFALSTPYPNPFNPTTTITFGLPQPGKAHIAIYDVLGRRVAVLANEFYPAGRHTLRWDAADMASGLYFARLQAGKFHQSQKLLLIK